MKKFLFIFWFFLFFFLACGSDNTQGGKNISCKSDNDCIGGICQNGICKDPLCTPKDNKCLDDGKTKHICKEDGRGFEDFECPFKCKNGECIDSLICSPYTKICVSNTEYIECKSSGVDWEKTECENGKYCLNGECKERICNPGEKTCLDSETVKSCNLNGTAELTYKCSLGKQCSNGDCIEIKCNPGEKKCGPEGGVITCLNEGTDWSDEVFCDNGKICDKGECKEKVCNEGEIVCSVESNRYYKECNDTLTGWGPPILCGEGKVCQNNHCVEKLCSPGERKCDENSKVRICNDDALSWSAPVECENGEVCKRGECVQGGVCIPGEKKCLEDNNGYFQVCDEWGTAWLNPVSCGRGSICRNGECEDIVCVPGETVCIEGDLTMSSYKICNENGTGFSDILTCDDGKVCLNGECKVINCIPGEKACSGNEVVICQNDGLSWAENENCGDGNSCVNGNCIEKICNPGEERCVENTNQFIEFCDSTGTSWINRHSCGTGSICENNSCKNIICSPGQTKCETNSDNVFLTCNQSGSGFENPESCPENEFCMTGKCMECFPGTKECVDQNSFKVCNPEGRWEESVACAGGDSCENGNCAVKICEPGEIKCLENNPQYFKTCNESGTAWLNPVSCGVGNTCVENVCKPIVCIQGETECFSSGSYIKCNDSGTGYSEPISCEDGQTCLAGACRSPQCNPGETVCEGNFVKECKEDGSWSNETVSCGDKVCEDGICKERLCSPLEFRCDINNANYKEQCNANGTAWTNRAPCGNGKSCIDGVCENIICTEGDKVCSDEENGYLVCNSTGTAYGNLVLCNDNQYCSNGQCIDRICEPGERVCDGNSVKICNSLGSNYSNPQDCPDGTVCLQGICESTICSPGETRCSGTKIQTCNDEGTGWNTAVSCPDGKTCSGNICIDYVCDIGERQCVNSLLYKECNAERTGYGNPISCGTNKICTANGVCMERVCSPGQTKCVLTDNTHKSYQICNANGDGWEAPVDCGGDLICDVDTNLCKSKICNPGDLRCLNEGGEIKSQTCNASGSGWNTPVVCEGPNPICTENGCEHVICEAYEEIKCTGNTPKEYKRCNLNGTGWLSSTENCADGYLCKQGTTKDECKPVICTPNSMVCSSEHTYRLCNSDGTELSSEITCENSPASGNPETCYAGECRTECEMSVINKSYMGCEYYSVELQNHDGTYSDGDYAIIVSNPGNNTVKVVIDGPNDIHSEAEIESNQLHIFSFDSSVTNQTKGTTSGDNYSYHIKSNLPVVVYQFSPLGGASNYTNDASLIMPVTAYGTEYRVLSWTPAWSNSNYAYEYFTIVAKEDNTTIKIRPSADTISGSGVGEMSEDENYVYNLNAGEIIQVAQSKKYENLSGSLIESDKPVGVFGGNACTQVPTGKQRCDHIEQQLFPVNTWGNHYVVVKTASRNKLVDPNSDNEDEYYKIVAAENGTVINFSVDINGSSTVNLDAGEVYNYSFNNDYEIVSNKPVMVGQFISSVEDTIVWDTSDGVNDTRGGDPAFILQVPVEQFRSDYLFLVPDTYTYDYVTIVAPSEATVTLDGNLIDESDYLSVTADYKKVIIRLTDGSHSIVSNEPVGISVYGYDAHVSYGYPGGLNLKAVK